MNRKLVLAVACLAVIALATAPALAATRVNTMPDRQVRPGTSVPVWGNAGNGGGVGDGTANGETYTWSFAANPDVMVTDDGSLTAAVGNDRYIVENVTFTLLNGSTRELVTATLDVNGTTSSVTIDIVDPTDPISTGDLPTLQIDTNIAIQDALRHLYRIQNGNGSWTGYSGRACASTGFAVWAFENSGHLPTNNINSDIYAEWVRDGLDYMQSTAVTSPLIAHAPADVAREATAAGISDLNSDGNSTSLCGGINYDHPIATAAFIASLDTASYQGLVENAIDRIGYTQNPGAGRGGWNYTGPSTRDDMSVDSWNYLALEGGQTTVFGIDAPDWILQEAEYSLISRQANGFGDRPFGYTSTNPLRGFPNGHGTTCGGLSGLAAVELESTVPVGSVINAQAAPLNSITARRNAALGFLGTYWGQTTNSNQLGYANRGNFYVMWTCCRALRLTEQSTGADVLLSNGGVTFDWETGEENGSGNVAAHNTTREGYSHWLVAEQQANGSWAEGTYLGSMMETALGLLCLNKTVFGPPEPECEDPDPRTQGYWHRQCLGLPAPVGIDPGRNGRGPSAPNDPNFEPTYRQCADEVLEELGFFGETTCSGMDAVPPNDHCEKALKQTTAVILNRCSGRLQDGCGIDVSPEGCTSTDVGGLINELVDLINSGDCTTAMQCAGAVNEGDALTEGGGGAGEPYLELKRNTKEDARRLRNKE